MREYKFRGFNPCENGKEKVYIDGKWIYGEWVYGSYLISVALINGKTETFHYIIEKEEFGTSYDSIIPETVGQYTGLNDENGKEIYEGDIVKYVFFKEEGIGKIIYEGCCYEIENEGCSLCVSCFDNQIGLEVIGNIHSNPELLEVE